MNAKNSADARYENALTMIASGAVTRETSAPARLGPPTSPVDCVACMYPFARTRRGMGTKSRMYPDMALSKTTPSPAVRKTTARTTRSDSNPRKNAVGISMITAALARLRPISSRRRFGRSAMIPARRPKRITASDSAMLIIVTCEALAPHSEITMIGMAIAVICIPVDDKVSPAHNRTKLDGSLLSSGDCCDATVVIGQHSPRQSCLIESFDPNTQSQSSRHCSRARVLRRQGYAMVPRSLQERAVAYCQLPRRSNRHQNSKRQKGRILLPPQSKYPLQVVLSRLAMSAPPSQEKYWRL